MVREHSIRQMWDDLALPELTRTLRLAIGPTKVLLAFLFVLLLCGGGLMLDLVTRSVTVLPPQAMAGAPTDSIFRKGDELAVYLENPSRTWEYIQFYREHTEGRGVFSVLWNFFAARFNHATTRLLELGSSNLFANLANVGYNLWLCVRALAWAVEYHPFYSLIYFTYAGLLTCFFGGAICRCAALEFARFEKPGIGEAIQFAREQWKSLLTAPLIPLGMLAGIGGIFYLVGLAGNIPWVGELLLGLLIGVLYLLGLAMSILLLAMLTGGGLLFPAVAYEKTTGLDSIGRAFSYVINQPLWMLFYTVVELILGTLFYLFIRLFVFLFLRLTYTLVSLGFTEGQIDKLHRIWTEPTFFHLLNSPMKAANWSEKTAWGMIYLSLLFIVALVMALVVSYFFSAITVLYALMRKKVDKIGITQVEVALETCSKDLKDSV
ncbi:MAG TPA: hypothetical protein PKY88_08225 [Anaerohalosphaeraceae bacterium]|nr:hypothetical protein [Anaerohalosphaeraceae bacterium]